MRRLRRTAPGGTGRRLFMDRRGPARQNHTLGVEGLDEIRIHVIERMNLAIHARFPHPACNQLRHLGAEIDDEDLFRVKIGLYSV